MQEQNQTNTSEAVVDAQFTLTWSATGILAYCLLSGLLIRVLPFGAFSQYTVLVHSAVGAAVTLPLGWSVYRHWQRRRGDAEPATRRVAGLSAVVLTVSLVTGLYAAWNGAVGGQMVPYSDLLHLWSGLLLGMFVCWHLYPVFARYRDRQATARRRRRHQLASVDVAITMVLISAAAVLAMLAPDDLDALASLPPGYELPYGAERPFWPSRAAIDGAAPDVTLDPALYSDARTCGSSGCHERIYEEWRPSAHGFAAEDPLFLRVQAMLAESRGVTDTRSCAGCHDPLALLAGTRDGKTFSEESLVKHDGVSCVFCHSVTATSTEGNGSYVVGKPTSYLFERSHSALGRRLNRYLIRRYPDRHRQDYSRPLYEESEFCAACHKQVPLPGIETDVGLAQEQNEYDSWKAGRWYHENNPDATIECAECHMPHVSGDDVDARHRSHRVLASNMYVPMLLGLPGGEKQAEMTIAWLRGEVDIPEIEHKWVDGPVVDIRIDAPAEIEAGELVNIALYLHNNKTGHDFPAGPLDLLESWVELKVEDNLGRTLLLLGSENGANPAVDAPVIYKADWYDRRGLPVETHNLWDAVGASYKHAIDSGGTDIVDIPFQCPGIARPRISGSPSESGPGERKTDVVFSISSGDVTELSITARLLYRKANPEFLRRVFDLTEIVDAPVIELTRSEYRIAVVSGS